MALDVKRPKGTRVNHKKGIAAAHLAKKRQEAVARQEAYAKKTVAEIIIDLNAGNYSAERQRRKLAARLASEQAKASAPKKEVKGAAVQKRRN